MQENKIYVMRVDTAYGSGNLHVCAKSKDEAVEIAKQKLIEAIVIDRVSNIPNGEVDFQ